MVNTVHTNAASEDGMHY